MFVETNFIIRSLPHIGEGAPVGGVGSPVPGQIAKPQKIYKNNLLFDTFVTAQKYTLRQALRRGSGEAQAALPNKIIAFFNT